MCPEAICKIQLKECIYNTSSKSPPARLDISSWTATSVQGYRRRCGLSSDRHPQCDGEVPVRCQQERTKQGF
jgi:hypothetical protein